MYEYACKTDDDDCCEKGDSEVKGAEMDKSDKGSDADYKAEIVGSEEEDFAEEQSDDGGDDPDDDDADMAWQRLCYTQNFINRLPDFFAPASQQDEEPTFFVAR
jgi:hypothetical protein